jgi:hypothetical protein
MNDVTQKDYYRDIRMVPYDLVKELAIALAFIGVVALVVSAILSSPDEPPVTIASWAQSEPVDFVTTATGELAGTTTSAGYGQPYNGTPDAAQRWGAISPQEWFGVRIPVDSADTFVIQPLQRAAFNNPELDAALKSWQSASSDDQGKWTGAYTKALADAKVADHKVSIADGDYGPLPVMMANLLGMAESGALDGLLQINGHFYETDYTRALLFMGDGGYLDGLADDWSLHGDQWGMMNETGQYPGQTWLWLYTMWYQVFPFNDDNGIAGLNAGNADLGIIILMTLMTAALALVPLIPILRDIPRWVPIHRLIWRDYYAPKRGSV